VPYNFEDHAIAIESKGKPSFIHTSTPNEATDITTKFQDAMSRRKYMIDNLQEVLEHVAHVDPSVDHTKRTAERFYDMLVEMCANTDFEFTTFESTSDEMVVLGPIPFYTLCAHHVVPFFGNAWIGYVPDKRVAGLSKIPRLVQAEAKGLWVQEELTGTIATALEDNLMPKGVAVVLKAEHLCMAMRGVRQPGVLTTTSAMRGVFNDHSRTAKAEFMEWIRNG
jgi:GTP cyclohydrolase IA